jgi:hypothetical protein
MSNIIMWLGPNGQRIIETEGFAEQEGVATEEMTCVKKAAVLAHKMGVPGEITKKEACLESGSLSYMSVELCG